MVSRQMNTNIIYIQSVFHKFNLDYISEKENNWINDIIYKDYIFKKIVILEWNNLFELKYEIKTINKTIYSHLAAVKYQPTQDFYVRGKGDTKSPLAQLKEKVAYKLFVCALGRV